MLDAVDLDLKLDKKSYERRFRPLRDRLFALQRAIHGAGIPVLLVLEGWDASGKGDTIEKLVGRLDPRGYEVHVTRAPTEEERLRPFLWRFWSRLPARGDMAIFDRSWYRRVLEERVEGEVPRRDAEGAFEEINQFERMLAEDGAVVAKFFLHLSRAEQRRRLQALEASEYESWRVNRADWRAHRKYKETRRAVEEMLERTSTPWAPWAVVPATDRRHRRVAVLEALAEALERALAEKDKRSRAPPRRPARRPEHTVLDDVDLQARLPEASYRRQLHRWQGRLRELEFICYRERKPVLVGFEGWDAAGKGGAIKRVIGSLDPRGYTVIPIAAPAGDEAVRHYLWRFWRRIPKAGHLAIFDRTWYGRVLVERVEGFCSEAAWRRAYHEIVEFERSLSRFGAVLVKFWLHVSPATQLRRFRERERDPLKRYKITPDDWRNRKRWEAYRAAVHDMVSQTSTTFAPWTIVEADDKNWARVRCLETLCRAIERGLG